MNITTRFHSMRELVNMALILKLFIYVGIFLYEDVLALEVNYKKLEWSDAIQDCVGGGGQVPSVSNVTNASIPNMYHTQEEYWILGYQYNKTYSYQGCFDESDLNSTDVFATNSIPECAGLCTDSPYLAVSANNCFCLYTNSNLVGEQTCPKLCPYNFEFICGNLSTVILFQRNDLKWLNGSIPSPCIYEKAGKYFTEYCNVTCEGNRCNNGNICEGQVTWIEAQEICNQNPSQSAQFEDGTAFWSPFYGQFTTIEENADLPVNEHQVYCAVYNGSSVVYRNCSDQLMSLCAVERPNISISENRTSWKEATQICEVNNGHLLDLSEIHHLILLSTLRNSSDYYWIKSENGQYDDNGSSERHAECDGINSDTSTTATNNNATQNVKNCLANVSSDCLAFKVEDGKITKELMNCSNENKCICFIDVSTHTVEPTKYIEVYTDGETTPEIETTTLDNVPGISEKAPKPRHMVPHTVYGLLGGIVAVVLILSIVCVVCCVVFRKYKEQQRELSMLKGPTISYSNLEHSDFASSLKPALGEISEDDPGDKMNQAEEEHDLVSKVVIRDDNSDVKSLDNYIYCDVVDENTCEKPKIENNNDLKEKENHVKHVTSDNTMVDGTYSFAKPSEQEGTQLKSVKAENTLGDETYSFADPLEHGDEDIYQNSNGDDSEVYQNHVSVSLEHNIKVNDDGYSAVEDNSKPQVTNIDGEYNVFERQGSNATANRTDSEYDRVRPLDDEYDHLSLSETGLMKTKPAVLYYEEVVLP